MTRPSKTYVITGASDGIGLECALQLAEALFEPDLGSYVRHLSSVALFSMVLLHSPRTGKAAIRRAVSTTPVSA